MADEQPEKKNEVTPKGAVEIEESDLDQATGGGSSNSKPTESISLNFTKIQFDQTAQKIAPTDLTSAGPLAPEKKI